MSSDDKSPSKKDLSSARVSEASLEDASGDEPVEVDAVWGGLDDRAGPNYRAVRRTPLHSVAQVAR